ncbi:MAG: gamma carbonic anhydrase family protein [Oscillospiraceae bacterium]
MLYSFSGKSPRIDPTAFVSDSAELIGDVTVGPRCYIGPFAVIRGDAAQIVLEEEVAVEDGVIIHAGGDSRICRRVTIGHGAIVHSRYLGPNVSIGMGAVLSLNCTVGEGSVIGESALVPQGKEIPAGMLVAGVPAKPLRELTERDIKSWQNTKDWYVRLTARYLDGETFRPIPDPRKERAE